MKDTGNIILSCLSKVPLLSTLISERMFLKGCSSGIFFGMYVLPSWLKSFSLVSVVSVRLFTEISLIYKSLLRSSN